MVPLTSSERVSYQICSLIWIAITAAMAFFGMFDVYIEELIPIIIAVFCAPALLLIICTFVSDPRMQLAIARTLFWLASLAFILPFTGLIVYDGFFETLPSLILWGASVPLFILSAEISGRESKLSLFLQRIFQNQKTRDTTLTITAIISAASALLLLVGISLDASGRTSLFDQTGFFALIAVTFVALRMLFVKHKTATNNPRLANQLFFITPIALWLIMLMGNVLLDIINIIFAESLPIPFVATMAVGSTMLYAIATSAGLTRLQIIRGTFVYFALSCLLLAKEIFG